MQRFTGLFQNLMKTLISIVKTAQIMLKSVHCMLKLSYLQNTSFSESEEHAYSQALSYGEEVIYTLKIIVSYINIYIFHSFII